MEEISLLPLREMLHHNDDRISHYVVYTLRLEEPCNTLLYKAARSPLSVIYVMSNAVFDICFFSVLHW